jgi:hypothetical protein
MQQRNDTAVSPAVGPGQPASAGGIGTFKGAANDELPGSEMLRVSVAEGREGARQASLSVDDVSMNAATSNPAAL